MIASPTKSQDSSFSQTLTPVRFLDSPKSKNTCSDSNVALCKSQLEVIMKSVDVNFKKWQLAEKRGIVLCSSIEAIKTKAFEEENSKENLDFSSYPDELKKYCEKLAFIVPIFQDITKHSRDSLRQLMAFRALPGCCNEIFYRSWELNEFIEFQTELLARYEKECKVKAYVLENLAHCTTRSDLMRCSTAWEYPQYVDSYVTTMFAFLREEISHKK